MSFKTYLVVILFSLGLTVLGAVLGSRSFIEDSDAITQAELAGYKDAKVESRHYLLQNLYGCKTLDAVAFVVSASHAGEKKRSMVNVCCGAWFSGCTVRKESP